MSTESQSGDAEMNAILRIAQRMVDKGPVKTLSAAPRRIRVVVNGKYIADTRRAVYIWEHEYYPQLYIPNADVHRTGFRIAEEHDGFSMFAFSVGRRMIRYNIHFTAKMRPELQDLVRIDFKEADTWYEEDIPIFVHPKDPFKRVDVLPSSAAIKIILNGVVLAEASFSMHLYETGLPVRYYLPVTSISQQYLRKSRKGTTTQCPYKGTAEYYDIVYEGADQNEVVCEDLVWYYDTPNLECAGIKGMACFYNEKVDLWVDGVKEEKPKTHFA